MKRTTFILIILIAWSPWFIGAWDKDKPAASTSLRSSNPEILANWAALETALGEEHNFPTDGTHDANFCVTAYIADSAVTTIKIADANVTTAKIADANITLAKMADDSIDSDQYVDGSIDTAHIADNQVTAAKIEDDFVFDQFPSTPSAAPDANYEVANKKYVDDQITAGADPAYSGGESHTFAGGLIFKQGYKAGVGSQTVTFGTAFPNDVVSASATSMEDDTATRYEAKIQSLSKTTVIISVATGCTGVYWQVWGY